MALNLANVQTTDTFQTWYNRTNSIIAEALSTAGGTVTGDLTVSGNALFSGNTTIVNKTIISTTDPLIQLASNNEFSDVSDIGFFGHYNSGSGNNHTGLIRDSGTKEYYLFGEYQPGAEPTDDINISHASFTLANLHIGTVHTAELEVTGSGQVLLPTGNTTQRTSTDLGAIRYNTEEQQFEGYGEDGWGQIGGGGLGKFLFKSSNYNAEKGDRIAANTAGGGFTVTLPLSPDPEEIVEFIDENNTFNTGNLTIARNGSTIENVAADLVADISGTNFYCQYDGTTWRVFGVATGTQHFNGTLSTSGLNVSGALTGNTATFSGIINAQDFISTSDVSFKQNIHTISDASSLVSRLRGVSFEWRETNQPSYGVVAQELEDVIPDLVSVGTDGSKSVKYNGLIGFLVESNKQLQQRIEALEQKLKDK